MRKLNVKLAVVFISIFLPAMLFAEGKVRGTIIDNLSGEPMIGVGAVISFEGKIFAGVTDFNGNYTILNVPAGAHTVRFQIQGYQPATANVNITDGGTARVNMAMSYQTRKTVVVKARRINNTTAALLSKRRKAPAAQDAISAEQISKSPDSDAADAAKRVTGVTIVGGNVFVRGLGERYSGVTFANSNIPSPDPDKRVVPLDIFPVGVLDNIVVTKTYTADQSGEFGGGTVQINPKDFPDELSAKVSIGTGYHSLTTFKDFYTYSGGKNDWFGVDDGTRNKPSGIGDQLLSTPDAYTQEQLNAIGKDIMDQYAPFAKKGILPLSMSFEFGNSYQTGKESKLGIMVSGLFKESSTNRSIEYEKRTSSLLDDQYDIEQSTYETTKGALVSLSFQPANRHLIKTVNFFTHQSSDLSQITEGYDRTYDGITNAGNIIKTYSLKYTETTLLFNQLTGKHSFEGFLNPQFTWIGTYSRATRDEPSRKSTRLGKDVDGNYYLENPDKESSIFFQDHVENIYDAQAILDLHFDQWDGFKSKFTMGSGYVSRRRESTARSFAWEPVDLATYSTSPLAEPLNTTINDAITDTISITENSPENNSYKGELDILSVFGQIDLPLLRKLRLVTGVRYENAVMDVISYDPADIETKGLDENPLTEHQILPSANLVYAVSDKMNIRAAFSKTVSRPDFREVSEFKYTTMVGNNTIQGNPELVETDIYNSDLRFEWFPSSGEIIAVSLFHKYLENPIELIELNTGDSPLYQYANAASAQNMGVELEWRQNLVFLADFMKVFTLSTNIAFIYSQIDVSGLDTAYTNDKRPLQGQSPYIINVSLDYELKDYGFVTTVLYNRVGRRISRVGIRKGNSGYDAINYGDVYEEPVDRLDFVMKKSFDFGGSIKFTASNLLDPKVKETQIINEGEDNEVEYTVESYKIGRSFSLSYSQKF